MPSPLSQLTGSITLQQSSTNPHHFDLYLSQLETLAEFDRVECAVFVYPQSRQLDADSFHLLPFEEYVDDVTEGQRSSYRVAQDITDKLFGSSLAVSILALFWLFNGRLDLSLEAIVAVFGAYAIGKELWQDIDHALSEASSAWPLRWHEFEYYYQREHFGTMQRFSQLGRMRKYGEFSALPSKLDFITHSNSKTVEMLFQPNDLTQVSTDRVRILTLEVEQSALSAFTKENFLLTVKLSCSKQYLKLWRTTELYQAVLKGQVGAVDQQNIWQKGVVLERNSWRVGKLSTHGSSFALRKGELLKI
jgi:hypothetical protein